MNYSTYLNAFPKIFSLESETTQLLSRCARWGNPAQNPTTAKSGPREEHVPEVTK